MSEHCPTCGQPVNDELLVQRIASWLRHIDRLSEIPGAADPLPEKNPLWDAAGAIEAHFGSK